MRCDLMLGRLVSHPCGRKTGANCSSCNHPRCKGHTDAEAGVCVECAGAYKRPDAPLETTWEDMFEFTSDEIAAFDERSAREDDVHIHDS